MARANWWRDARSRRMITIPGVAAGSGLLTGTAGLWAPAAVLADLASGAPKLPRTRLVAFAWGWTTLETVGVGATAALAALGQGDNRAVHYALQRWWADRLVDLLERLAGLRIEVEGLDQLAPGPIVLVARHVSVADALVPMWLLGRAGMVPRYVMKDELLVDPCLDIVGNRVPNHFVARGAGDTAAEVAALEAMAHGMGTADAAIIFPEGMVVTEARRTTALRRLADRDPARAARLAGLSTLAPPRPAGTEALLRAAPDADLVIVTHTGLEPLRQVADAPSAVPLTEPLRIAVRRISRSEIPLGAEFGRWFDDRWVEADARMPGDRVATGPRARAAAPPP